MGNLRFRLQMMFIALVLGIATAAAQNIRYVKTNGDNAKDGTSWANAKKDIQDAINDLVNSNLSGEVWVAAGTYYPTESTEASSSQYYKSFKIPAGITVRGGFRADLTAAADGKNTTTERPLQNDKNFGKAAANSGNLDGEGAKSGVYENKTILCGDLLGKKATFSWNDTKQQFDATFYGNSYHVVWFAMNGFNATTKRANPLAKPAKLEGCVVEGGHAYTRNGIDDNVHEGYGGGIYMVANSFVYNCEVRNCDASRNGGGIYMDGGGIVRRTYVHDCQALGVGTEFGLGGGICEEGTSSNSKKNPIVTAQSVVTNCVARMGGGMALIADQTEGDAKFTVTANSTIVNNNTAQVEGGGIYTHKGGAIASLTVVNNKCVGSGITQSSVVTGRSGGVYSRDASYIGNTVMWGNKCSANNDVQFASSRTSLTDAEKTHFYYNAVSNMDNTDWSGTDKMGVLSLANTNKHDGSSVGSKGFPLFFKPTASAGYLASATTDPELNWQVSSESFLTYAGIATADLDNKGLTPAPTGKSWDMQFGEFNARPTIGALVSQIVDIKPAENITYEGVTYDYAFFVDPQFIYAEDNEGYNGGDWEHPLRFLGNALDFIADNGAHQGVLRADPIDFTGKKVAVFVKQGNVDNTRTWGDARVRVASLDIPSNVALFGSFSGHLVGNDLSLQNVVHTPTVINGQLMNDYKYNIAHLINITGKHDIHIHGFKLSYANASSTELTNDNKDGAAITIVNSKDIKFHNILVSNCTADHGAAVYADKSTIEFENCIFHNNETKTVDASGIIYATNGSVIDFNHCDVLRNVGHASYLGAATYNHWQNSIFYGNMDRPVVDTNTDARGDGLPVTSFAGNYTNATGSHCMFDATSKIYALQFGGNDTGNKWQYDLQYTFADGTGQGYPRFINPTKNAGVTVDGDHTYYGRGVSYEPHNNNPIVNMASHADIHTSWGKDIVDVTRDFGGLPDIGAVENHMANHAEEGENAYTDGQRPYGEGYYVRDYTATGTNIPTYSLNSAGHPVVNPEGKGTYNAAGELLDGSSWEYAINGNAIYSIEDRTETPYNTVYKTPKVDDPSKFKGTFTIKTTSGKYIYLDANNTPKTTDNADNAAHFEVEGVSTSSMSTGTKYIRTADTHLYLYRNNNTASSSTTTYRVDIASVTGGYTIRANKQFYIESNGSIQAPKSGTATTWVFTPDYELLPQPETPYKQDAATEVTNTTEGYATTDVANGAVVVEPMQFHVYHSLEDYQNSNEKKTFKIRGNKMNSTSYVHLANKDNYFYPYPSWTGNGGDEFILIQDGEYGKYYIYDVTVQKYMYYYTGTATGSRVRAGYDSDKTTWWIDKNGDKLNFVYGGQPWATTGNYAIQVTANSNTAVSVGLKTSENAPVSLISNQAYTAINYNEVAVTGESHNGLQYAVNNASKAFMADPEHTTNPKKAMKQVWVGAGVYASDPEVKAPADNSSDTDPEAENCYVIRDGVNVYGAFPKNGNPGMDQRQALVSQYVYVQAERGIANPADFETILEPKTKGVTVGVTRRVLGQTWNYNPKKDGYQTFIGAKWDGFTLRDGVLDAAKISVPNRHGGAGAAIYKNVTLKNVVVTNNTTIFKSASSQQDFRAGGIYCDGGTLDAGYVINNKLESYTATERTKSTGAAYGGGMYIYSGTVFNSVISRNSIYAAFADGAGTFIEDANFFNNTIVYNKAEGTNRMCGGVAIWNDAATRGSESELNVYNCIIAKNEGTKLGKTGNANMSIQSGGIMNINYCITEDAHTSYVSGSFKITFNNCQEVSDYSTIFVTDGTIDGGFKDFNLRLKPNALNAINNGHDSPTIHDVTYDLSDYNDMDFAERIQDCRIDIGAYEFNGSTAVAPQMLKADGTAAANMEEATQLVFYVTHMGFGTTNANDPENAACASKLQRVIDAAGRYKYLNPTKQVIVKVANDWNMLHPASGEAENFTYYATRTTDQTDQDVRVWSIIVPRGVEVWGGYTDVPTIKDANGNVVKNTSDETWSNSNNGFTYRSITANPTYFDSHYVNKREKTDANTYHVVTFTDRIFDQNGLAYTKHDFEDKTPEQVKAILQTGAPSTYVELSGNNESLFAHMSESIASVSTGVSGNTFEVTSGSYASNRAVIDGIFVSGGQADAPANSNSSQVNINSYGGAALVNDFAYVRNCVLTGNTALNGGALALTDNALVSGCLIMDNTAHNAGGGIYVFEHGTKLSNGHTVNTDKGSGPVMDYNMSHVLTSTIVRNTAQQGGGVWYTNDLNANARFNSVAIWQNTASDQSNVYGMVNPEQPTDDETLSEEFYPFSYSIIQNIRASGTNNLDAEPLNDQGMRFVKRDSDMDKANDLTDIAEEKNEGDIYEDFGFYGLTTYSVLCSGGMPVSKYSQLKQAIAISDIDIIGTPRVDANNAFVEVGARALAKVFPKKQLMLRIFVAHPKYVDTKTAVRFMRLARTASSGSKEEYYSQEGSSFAYPFNSLQDALDYVKQARNGQISDDLKLNDGTIATSDIVRDLPFEIVVGKGTYYPRKDLNGDTRSVWAHTFAVPEGVTIIGGFNPKGGNGTYYGRYYKKGTKFSTATNIYDGVDPIPTGTQSGPAGQEIGRGYNSGEESVTPTGGSAITFQQWHIQDIADRRGMSDNNKNGIIEPWEFTNQTIISGNAVNGETDGVYHIMTAVADEDAVGKLPKVQSTNSEFVGTTVDTETGYQSKEEGQQIRLNGLIITGGNALTYLSTALDEYGKYIFYQGAGLQVDGNRYKNNSSDPAVFHNSAAYGVGYRDIPVSVTNCQFRNNKAGYGGAISTNGSLSLFGSSFEQNLAIAQTEKPKSGETWTTNVTGTPQNVSKVMYPGQGGAILATHQLSAFNTLFANNEARLGEGETKTINLVQHPTFRVPDENAASATLRAAGGAIMMGSAAEHHIVNCNFVRNKANAYPAVFTMNPTKQQPENINTHFYSQIINTVAWGNEVNEISSNADYLRASKLMVNIGKKNRTQNYIKTKGAGDFYDPSFENGKVPTDADLSNNNAEENTDWQEAAWFCAYEDGVGFKPNNTNDLREAITYSALKFAPWMIKEANVVEGVKTYQNCNLLIVAENGDVAGPNFGYPSIKAGYDGFMEGADWSPARFNRLTDNGNGWIKQTVEATANDIKVTFHNNEAVGTGYQGAYSYTHYISDILGATVFPEYKLWLAIGNEKYMQATNDQEPQEQFINNTSIGRPQKNYPRISPDPTIGVTKAYIDIGVYEYVKQPLLKPGDEVDILWVSTEEHPENGPANGLTWKTPTSDLQKAIETLLQSRNGHKKEIRIMEGVYAPVTPQTVNSTKYNAFVIDTKKMNESAITPTGFNDGSNNDQYYAQSITIKGGYSSEIPYDYDPVKYKTVIRQMESLEGANTDYLIYIADPTVRYAGKGSGLGNENATFGSDPSKEASKVKTMPIQVDGVTLVNDKATANKQGSAIYYPDYADEVSPAVTVTEAHSVSVGGQVRYYPNKTEFDKKDGSGNHIGTTCANETEFVEVTTTGAKTITNPAKILITKTEVIGSGKSGDNNNGSAVYIGKNGGSALIYNTVFHSNYGMPLNAWNTVNVNNTFAKNAGLVQLRDAAGVTVESQMHNSALWLNNSTAVDTYGDQVHFGDAMPTITGTQTIFTYNSYTGGNTVATDYADGSGTVAGNNYNTGLTNDNADIVSGPNFVNPGSVADVTTDAMMLRNFDIKPSVRLLNKGNDASITSGSGKYYTIVVANKYDYSLASITDKEVLYRNRLSSTSIDVGAYEFQGNLQKVLYVDPNKTHNDAATGENWDQSFGYGDIQDAMDLAAVYHMNNPTDESYVFVKGNSATSRDRNTNETLTIRDGVTVYGSIMSNYNDWHDIKDPENPTLPKYRKETSPGVYVYDIDAFIKDMTNQREGVASDAASKTIVTGIKTSSFTSFNGNVDGSSVSTTPALIDGFMISNKGNKVTEPVLDVTNTSQNAVIVLRNILVADNDFSTADVATNAAEIRNGLIYEALFRDNKMPEGSTGAVLEVGNYHNATPGYDTKGYAVNVTVEGVTKGADQTVGNEKPVDGLNNSSENIEGLSQIYNSITNSINGSGMAGTHTAGGNGSYGSIGNKHISGYFYNIYDANLNYQLTETSKYIDMCTMPTALTEADRLAGKTLSPLNGVTGAEALAKFINYETDRDLLGNPRWMRNVSSLDKIDRGAFETWRVDKDFVCGKWEKNSTWYGTNKALNDAIAHHFYPHDGSVVYIMENKSLVIDPLGPDDMKATPENPGFLLLKEGANFYGNGRPATCAYVAVERKVRKAGNIVNVPYTMKYKDNVAVVTKDGENVLVLTPREGKEVRTYNGDSRSDWKYIFKSTESTCWDAVASGDVTAANRGVFYMPNDAVVGDDNVFRFTGKGTSLTDYVYTESGDCKAVVLTKYDDSQSTAHGADFTDEKDMGWNCVGLPYLVSSYQTYANTSLSGSKYQMNIPHEMWLYYDGTVGPDNQPVNGNGGYYSVNSWENTDAAWHVTVGAAKDIWVGEGIFVQTATLEDTESLVFYRPVAPDAFPVASPAKKAVRYFFNGNLAPGNGGEMEVEKAEDAQGVTIVATEYYTASGMHLKTNGDKLDYNSLPIMPRGTVIICRKHYSDGTSKTQKFCF